MQVAYYDAPIAAFLEADEDSILGTLVQRCALICPATEIMFLRLFDKIF